MNRIYLVVTLVFGLNHCPAFSEILRVPRDYETIQAGIDAGIDSFVWQDRTLVDIDREDYIGDAPDMGGIEHDPENSVRYYPAGKPHQFTLLQNYPNPFNSGTMVRFELFSTSQVKVTVHDLEGRLVSELMNGATAPGLNNVLWDGRLQNGNPAGSGNYIYRIETHRETLSGRMTLIR